MIRPKLGIRVTRHTHKSKRITMQLAEWAVLLEINRPNSTKIERNKKDKRIIVKIFNHIFPSNTMS